VSADEGSSGASFELHHAMVQLDCLAETMPLICAVAGRAVEGCDTPRSGISRHVTPGASTMSSAMKRFVAHRDGSPPRRPRTPE
jgi:hypothetical protein